MTTPDHFSFPQIIGLRLFFAVSAAMLGSWVAVSFKKISHLGLCALISFAAGALLAVALFDIFPETFHLIGLWKAAVSFLSGYFLFFIITRFVFHICPACAATHTEVKFKAVTAAMLVALSIHSFMDGLAIYSGTLTGASIGILILVAVVYHKFPEGMALSLVALNSGMSRSKSFWMSILVESSTTLAGGLIGLLFLMSQVSSWIGYVLGHIGGGFVFLVIHALLSEVIKHHPRVTLLSAFLGALTILFMGFFVGAYG